MEATRIDNDLYNRLGERWYAATDDPVALLRAERRLVTPWIIDTVRARLGATARVLDVGCGAGLLSNPLAANGFSVTGVDLSEASLAVARQHDATSRVTYRIGDACDLSFDPGSFDVVCAMDVLEHVDHPETLVAGAARMLRPGGLFFFNTFNKNPLAWLVVIKGVEWFVRNTPPNMHVLELFIRPDDLRGMCAAGGLRVEKFVGLRPKFARAAFWRMLATGRVEDDFEFTFTASLLLGYGGIAVKT